MNVASKSCDNGTALAGMACYRLQTPKQENIDNHNEQEEVTDEELALYKESFDAYDLDGDGAIDMAELGFGFEKMGGGRHRRESLSALIDSADANKDGKLQFDEFVYLMRSKELEEFLSRDTWKPESGCILSDVYGGKPNIDETPNFVAEKLKDLEHEIHLLPIRKKKGYMSALEKCPDLAGDENLRLNFLRCKIFDAKEAANRFVGYWNKRIKVFGPEKAFLPLTLDEALKDDHVAMSIGFVQVTGQNDPGGRGIIFLDYSKEGTAKYENLSLVRVVWYVLHTALRDVNIQKQGIVLLIKCSNHLSQWNAKVSKIMADSLSNCLPIRIAGFHPCHPPKFMSTPLKLSRVFLGSKLGKRFHVHRGSNEEVLEELSTYGISTEAVPTLWGGSLALNC